MPIMKYPHIYDIVVVGAGPAGTMAAIRAGQLSRNVLLIEKNSAIGRKILLTGKGRCNLTNMASLDTFIKKFGRQGQFLRQAFSSFFNQELIDFFKAKGLDSKVERQNRVFPVTDNAGSVVDVLKEYLKENKTEILYNRHLQRAVKKDNIFHLELDNGNTINARKVILATGGISYKATGSTGDGFHIAEQLGHTIAHLKPALVPLKTQELWVKELTRLDLKNIRLTFRYADKKIVSPIGDLAFTPFGVSGSLILDLSGEIVSILEKYKQVNLLIDLKPGLTPEQLGNRLLREIKVNGNSSLKNVMKNLLPHKLIKVFIRLSGIDPETKANQITREQRNSIIKLLKALPLTITGSLPIEEAMVTNGGVSTCDINAGSMESKIIPGLYFAGEIIDGCASSGGYNLQQAFSTGYLAGEHAASG